MTVKIQNIFSVIRKLYYVMIRIFKRGLMFLSNLFYSFYRKFYTSLTWKHKAGLLEIKSGGLKLNLGCGDSPIKGMLNCEIRATKAADLIMDCSNLAKFKNETASLIYSHAVFEHMYRHQQLPLLKDCLRALIKEGILLFMGIPDFEIIAKSYIEGVPGIQGVGDKFDLFHVYRYTHGDPEMAEDYWLEQLHKSLFDKKSIADLLSNAGFTYGTIFNYCYPGENIPLNLGFVAWKKEPTITFDEIRRSIPDLPTGKLGEVKIYINGKLKEQ